MVSINSDNTAIVSLLSYLNISNIITLPHTTYDDTNVLSASLADKINYYLVNITSIDLILVTGYTNYYSGTCTLDKTFNELLEAINNKYNIQIYFSPYNSYCKVSTYVKNNSIIELSFILDRAFFKIAYIKSTNNITITQYSISDVTNSISNDNINAISSGAVYNLKTDLESKISSITGYIKPFVITVTRDVSTREYKVVGAIDAEKVQNALNAHNLILLKDDTIVMPLTMAYGNVEEGITLQFFTIYGDGNEHSNYIISVVGYEATVDYYDYMYATYEQVEAKQDKLVSGTNIKTINGESILGAGNIKVGVPTIQAGTGGAAEVFNGNSPSAASGLFSHAEGEGEATGATSHAEGKGFANGEYSHAEGFGCSAEERSSHAEGNACIARGENSHAEGKSTIAKRQNSHAEGSYNIQDDAAIHSVGIGTSSAGRKDAHRITYDGKHYILGIGGFDGTKATANLTNEKDLATVINGYETRIAALETALAGIKSN